jgi:hypothetical protein
MHFHLPFRISWIESERQTSNRCSKEIHNNQSERPAIYFDLQIIPRIWL